MKEEESTKDDDVVTKPAGDNDPLELASGVESSEDITPVHSAANNQAIEEATKVCGQPRWLFIIVLLTVAIGAGSGLGVALSNLADVPVVDTFAPTFAPTSQNSENHKEAMKQYIIDNLVSTEQDLGNSASPQSLALAFLASKDKKGLNAPIGGLDSKEGYAFITRYAMTTLYYATQGASWTDDLVFLSEDDTCDWYEVFAPPIGQVGVLCKENTNEIVGISFSKLFIC
jgi:hypothetical protein